MRVLWLLVAAGALQAQSPSFEVVSIKPAGLSDPHGMRVGASGGPGSKDPGRWTAENMSLQDLILMAYDLKRFQLSGPSWLPGDRFHVQAKVPEGATREQLREMVQRLLSERFGLAAHRERKEASVYRLVVAKGGSKLVESPPRDPNADPPKAGTITMGRDGYPEIPPGVPMMLSARGRVFRQAVGESMGAFASMLAGQVGRPVVDATGLKGVYDFVLKWDRGVEGIPGHSEAAAGPEDVGPSLMTALQDQLGLKLEAGRGEVEILVIDRLEKAPTEN